MTIRSDHKTTARCSLRDFFEAVYFQYSHPLPEARLRPRNARPSSLLLTHTYYRPSFRIGVSLEHHHPHCPFWPLLSSLERPTQRSTTLGLSKRLYHMSPYTCSCTLHRAILHSSTFTGTVGRHGPIPHTRWLGDSQDRWNSQAGNIYGWSGNSIEGLRDFVSIAKRYMYTTRSFTCLYSFQV